MTHDLRRSPRARRVALALVAVLVAGLAAYTVHSLTGAGGGPLLEDWVYDGLLLGAGVMVVARGAIVRAERAPWLVLGLGMVAWAGGVIEATLRPDFAMGGFPTSVDLLWLAYYPAAYIALLLLVRARVQRFYVSLWLDGLVGALALSALVSAVLFPALTRNLTGPGADVLADLAYPVADVLLAGFVLWVGALTQWRPGRVLGLVALALLAGALVDCWSLWYQMSGGTTLATRLDWLWPASAVLLAVAAWTNPGPPPVIQLGGMRPLGPPVVFAASALVLLCASRVFHVDTTGFLLAGATLAAVIVRMAVTFAENLRMVERSRREALTDPLTGLGNRRELLVHLRQALQQATPDDPRALLIFDLDGFKAYNDTFGHPAGDALLERLGLRLQETTVAGDTAYRLGGDEFCVLTQLRGRSLDIIAASAGAALTEREGSVTVTASWGAARLPAEACDVAGALRIADARLYAQKGARRGRRGDAAELEAARMAATILAEYDVRLEPGAVLAALQGPADTAPDPNLVRDLAHELAVTHQQLKAV